MANTDNVNDNDPFRFLEIKAAQIRKLLLGSLLLAKDAWKDALLGTPEGRRVLKTVEDAEDDFIDSSISEPFAKLDNVLSVINRRARAVVELIDYITQTSPKGQGR